MAVVGFTQDPEAPEGAGMFHLDDGRSIFAHDPDMARSVSGDQREALYGPDPRVAGPGAGQAPPPDPTAQLSFNPGGPNSGRDEYQARQDAEKPKIGPPAPPPGDVMAPASPTVTGGASERDRNVDTYLKGQLKQQGTPRKEAWVPKTKAETVETEGVPYDPEDAALRIKANQQIVQAKGATAEMLRQRAVNEIAEAKKVQPALLQKAAEAQTQLDAQHAGYLHERSDLEKAIQASNESQGGASEWFAHKGTLAQVAMVLGQAFGAYAATLSGGNNWAQQQVNTIMENDIASQKEQAKRGVDNALKRLELRYKNKDQAEAALRIAQGNVLQNVQSMHAAANQAQDVQAAHQEWLADNQAQTIANEQKFQNASYGKHKITVDTTHQAAGGGGPPDLVALAKKLKAMGFSDEEVKRHLFGGGNTQADAIDRKNVATIGGQPYEFDREKDAVTATERVPKLDKFVSDAERLKALYAKPGKLTEAERGEVTSLQREMGLEFGPAFTGSTRVNMDEVHEGWNVVGDPNSILKTDTFGHKTAGLNTLIAHAKAERDGVMNGGMRVNRQTLTNEKGQRERGYSYQTAPTTAEEVQ